MLKGENILIFIFISTLLHLPFLIKFKRFLWRAKLLFMIFFIASFTVKAQDKNRIEIRHRIEAELKERGEAYIAIPLTRHKSELSLSALLSPGQIKNDTAFYYITAKDTTLLYSSDINYSIVTAPSLLENVKMASSEIEVLEGLGYPTYSQYQSIMQAFKNGYSQILSIDTIGYSVKNRLILAARIQTGNIPAENRPVVFLSSTIHGNEPLGYVILLIFLNELTQNYDSSSEFSNLLDKITLIINPLANPDGTYFQGDNTIFGSTRNNFNNTDLNRNFPDPYKGWAYGDERQAETLAMMRYMDKFRPSLSANLHSGAEVVNYPWDWGENQGSGKENAHPDDAWFQMISSEYANEAKNSDPEYMNLYPGGITNGAYWYVVYGGRQDYVTGFLQGRELTLELSNDFIPPASKINWFYQTNRQPIINFIKQASYGIHGKITDKESGKPLGKVKIKLQDIEDKFSFVYSDSLSGFFHRYIKGGNYRLIFEKEGYFEYNEDISIADYETLNLQILMAPDKISCIPNPFINELHIKFYSLNQETAFIEIFSLTGQILYSASYRIVEGINNFMLKPALPPGIYILKVSSGDKSWKKKIVKYEY